MASFPPTLFALAPGDDNVASSSSSQYGTTIPAIESGAERPAQQVFAELQHMLSGVADTL